LLSEPIAGKNGDDVSCGQAQLVGAAYLGCFSELLGMFCQSDRSQREGEIQSQRNQIEEMMTNQHSLAWCLHLCFAVWASGKEEEFGLA
jgi:hypothetical protein